MMLNAAYNYAAAASNWRRMLWLAINHQADQATRGGKLAIIIAFMEPLTLILAFYLVRGIYRNQQAQFGTSLFLFLATGVMPFYLFLRISTRARTSKLAANTRLPGLTGLDMYIAVVFFNALIWIGMTVAVIFSIWLYGIPQARPSSIVDCALPIILFVMLAAGVGMINNVIMRFFPLWGWIYPALTRGLIFLSGVVVIVDFFPLWLRKWCVLNPLVHGIEWFRLGVYGRYPHNSLDPAYLVQWAFIALFLGLVLDRATIRKVEAK